MRGLYRDATPKMQNTLGTLRLLEGPRTKNAEQREELFFPNENSFGGHHLQKTAERSEEGRAAQRWRPTGISGRRRGLKSGGGGGGGFFQLAKKSEGDDPKVFEAKIQIVVIFTWVLSFVV